MRSGYLAAVVAILSLPMTIAADPLVLATETRLQTDDWYPLEEDQMTAAVADAAHAVLTGKASLRLVEEAATGSLIVNISLLGRARTAKATIMLDSPRTGSLVSTAAVSLDGMDHQGIFRAFEHIGTEAGRRLAMQLDVRTVGAKDANGFGSPELKELFDRGTRAKRQADFDAAREAFLRVMQFEGEDAGNWPGLAADEIRYGLPIFHARHLLFGGGRFQASPDQALSNLDEAETLLRRVYAENAGDAARVAESQRLLDQIQLTRTAMRRAMEANALSKMSPLRMMLAEELMTTGECPAGEALGRIEDYLPDGISFDSVSGTAKARTYRVSDAASGLEVDFGCDSANMRNPVTRIIR